MLRGINVSGQKKVNMQDLKALYEELKLCNISTYIQSGNIVFDAEKRDTDNLARVIEQKLLEKYTFEVPVIVKTVEQLQAIVNSNPFLQRRDVETSSLHITFLWQAPSSEEAARLLAINAQPDECMVGDRAVYVYCPNGYGRTKLTNTFIESKLHTIATTRNWNTVNKLVALGRQHQ
jgi:uncharacterized protein (DUF1697 family)